ncbi:MAG: MarR family transcriptional regulator [Methanoregula sp.]|jgi:DNA-binding MarR family transcriptional regulator|nr:MarR family transcriptional regulator [Methanoregula sp.]
MADDIQDRVADGLLALMLLYHRHILKTGPGISGIRIAQYRVLGLLVKSGPLSMSEIGRRLYISKPSMTTLADTLIANGWAERCNDPKDRRVINLAITPEGKEYLRQAFEIYKGDVSALLSGLDDLDLQQLSATLDDLQRIFLKLERAG